MSMTAKVTAKGQITIPVAVRRELGIATGDDLLFYKGLDGSMHLRVRRQCKGAGRGTFSWPEAPRSTEDVREAIEGSLGAKHGARRNRDDTSKP